MKVIFVKDLKKQARKGDIKEVKDGYAQNFLIKNGYAIQVTEKNMEIVRQQNSLREQEEQAKIKEALEIKQKLEKLTLIFKVKTGEQDRVFGSISPKQIKEELLKKGYKIEKTQIELINTLQSLGYHKVNIILYKDIKVEIKVQLVK